MKRKLLLTKYTEPNKKRKKDTYNVRNPNNIKKVSSRPERKQKCVDYINMLGNWLRRDYYYMQYFESFELMSGIKKFLVNGQEPGYFSKRDEEWFKCKKVDNDLNKDRIDDKYVVVLKELLITGFLSRLLGWLEIVEITFISPSKGKIQFSEKYNSIKLLASCAWKTIELLYDYVQNEINQKALKEKIFELYKAVDMAYYWDDNYGLILKFIEQELGECEKEWKDVKIYSPDN
jgi:hypothetical protein